MITVYTPQSSVSEVLKDKTTGAGRKLSIWTSENGQNDHAWMSSLNISSFLLSQVIATEQCRSTLLSVIQLSPFPLAPFSQICTLITKFNICNSCFHLCSFYKGHCKMTSRE